VQAEQQRLARRLQRARRRPRTRPAAARRRHKRADGGVQRSEARPDDSAAKLIESEPTSTPGPPSRNP
jgi:hypothetical protein